MPHPPTPLPRGVLPQRIRAWLATQDGPRWPSEVAAGIGLPGDIRVTQCLLRMKKEGTCAAHGDGAFKQYGLARAVRPSLTPEQRIEARRASEHRRYLRKRAARGKGSAPTTAPTKPVNKPSARSAITITPSIAPLFAKPAPAKVPCETVEGWMQRTGQTPERIPATWERQP